jgi:hypothetical protein
MGLAFGCFNEFWWFFVLKIVVCFWEDDVVQNYDPNFSGGANDPSLNDAKNNYIKYKVADKKNKNIICVGCVICVGLEV